MRRRCVAVATSQDAELSISLDARSVHARVASRAINTCQAVARPRLRQDRPPAQRGGATRSVLTESRRARQSPGLMVPTHPSPASRTDAVDVGPAPIRDHRRPVELSTAAVVTWPVISLPFRSAPGTQRKAQDESVVSRHAPHTRLSEGRRHVNNQRPVEPTGGLHCSPNVIAPPQRDELASVAVVESIN